MFRKIQSTTACGKCICRISDVERVFTRRICTASLSICPCWMLCKCYTRLQQCCTERKTSEILEFKENVLKYQVSFLPQCFFYHNAALLQHTNYLLL